MQYQIVESRIEYKPDIPAPLAKGLLNLYGVNDVASIPDFQKKRIARSIQSMFSITGTTDYHMTCNDYALYYLPINIYKVWRPMLDLVMSGQLPSNCEILELGAGPGSATFGIIEFYKYLAYENHLTEFNLTITIVEREYGFCELFLKLYSQYKNSLPENLTVNGSIKNCDAYKYLEDTQEKYNLIVESNMLNPNEHLKAEFFNDFSNHIKEALKPNSSFIMIEPAKKSLTESFKMMRKYLLQAGLLCFSPCRCNNLECKQFASARIDISGIQLLDDLKRNNIITQLKTAHSFEYAVFRNDDLSKYEYAGTDAILSKLGEHIGEKVKFKAFILTFASETAESFSLKVCDGSLSKGHEVWLYVPKAIMEETAINCLTTGRGGMIDVKNALVENTGQIKYLLSTRVRICQ